MVVASVAPVHQPVEIKRGEIPWLTASQLEQAGYINFGSPLPKAWGVNSIPAFVVIDEGRKVTAQGKAARDLVNTMIGR